MKQLIVQVDEEKVEFLKELLGNFDFVKVSDDWFDQINEKQKKSISKGLDDLDQGKTHTTEEVMAAAKEKIASLSK